ncbi:energy-coupling factor transporter transmembrane protein EcfT [Synergistaceae bacterium OttesenSCG-928-I11]|nr:energy-coupling factor transporter transmembrane protein EcfT [Synergistaceae bacterium OttesenSCG-928-I11]
MRFMNGISLGQFIPGDSPIHNLDPRCKIASTFALLAGLFLASTPYDFILWGGLLALLSHFSKISIGTILRSGRPVLFLIVITVILNLFWTPGHELFRIGPLAVTREGAVFAFSMGMRLYFLVVFAAMLMMTTSPMSFSDGLERLFSPFSKIGFPASEMAMMMTIALRFIPTLFEETDRILKAQISRGADFESGGLIKRAKSFIPVLIPLFVLVFQRAENLATAMEARCYVPGAKRARLNPLAWRMGDTLAIAFVLGYIAFVMFAERTLFRALPL